MYIYFIFLLIPYFFLYIKKDSNLHNTSIFPITYLSVLFIFLGLRLEFGTDWYEYSKDYFQTVSSYQNSNLMPIRHAISHVNLGYVTCYYTSEPKGFQLT